MYAHCFGRLLSLCNSLGVGKLQPLQVSHNLRKFVRICNCLQNWSRQLFFLPTLACTRLPRRCQRLHLSLTMGGLVAAPTFCPYEVSHKRLVNGFSTVQVMPALSNEGMYQLFHKTGRMQFDKVKPSNPGMPSGYLEFLIGGGPCIYRLNLLNLALKTVPHRIL